MKSDETSKEFSGKITSLVNQIRILGGELEEEQIVEKVLRSLPSTYNHIVSAIVEANDIEEMSLTELMGSLQSHEDLLLKDSTNSSNTSSDKAFQANVITNQKSERKQPTYNHNQKKFSEKVK